MPEGHSVHRIALQFERNFVGKQIWASSPQGRFAPGAAELDGRVLIASRAVGKQLFLEFSGDRFLRVHLGLYGAWDFAGDISADVTRASARRRMKQASLSSRGDEYGEDSQASIGAPRLARLRMSEQEKFETINDFPPEPVGAVRVRLLAADVVGDLRGPTACEVLSPEQVQLALAKLGPDPLVDPGISGENRFTARVRKTVTPIGLLLMDQSVVSGIGNVYRAEILFRARLNPHTRGKDVPEETVRALWDDWGKLLKIGVELGQMMTMDDLTPAKYRAALTRRDSRHWVYHREGKPCRLCGAPIAMELAAGRKLYWCPNDQA